MKANPDGTEPIEAANPPDSGWSRQRWFYWVTVALAVHVALIFIFATRKQILPRAVKQVPQFQLAARTGELVALINPTLFALPNAHDFAAAIWLKTPTIPPPSFRYAEPPGWLPLAVGDLGKRFNDFIQTNTPAKIQPDFKPEPPLAAPASVHEPAPPKKSSLIISTELAQRRLIRPLDVPAWSGNDVIAPSRVQVLVDSAGEVSSAVLLPEGNPLDHDAAADQLALGLARTLRFAPGPDLMFGELIFNWHAEPLSTTNGP